METLITRERINDTKVRPIPGMGFKKEKVLGADYFPECLMTCYMVAAPRSGKTTTIYNIIKNRANKNTIVILFVGTLFNDASYKEIVKLLKRRKIPFILETSFEKIDPETGKKYDQLEHLVKFMQNESFDNEWVDLLCSDSEDSESDESDYDSDEYTTKKMTRRQQFKRNEYSDSDESDEDRDYDEKPKKSARKNAIKSPELLFVLDDISSELRKTPMLEAFLKEFRHHKAQIYVSSQTSKDLSPNAIKVMSYVLLFAGISDENLKHIYNNINPRVSYEVFKGLYEDATAPNKGKKVSHNFLYVERNGEMRKNFNERYNLREWI